ncbi:DUF4883 family protein [Clostridium oryzae]|uniref:Lipoprotein n=1 Tax=Clostridium oryzae TaxID=1450648 RepID=A0A1V4IHZ6_9CLOT|nr:DUF4883 family protein [Clostridium oryzae]OPJ59583.1 hypothetical protein CLORY_32300 [Clostridium oryzae]
MKRIYIYFAVFITMIFFSSCSLPSTNILTDTKKPCKFFYTNKLSEDINTYDITKIYSLETNIIKEKKINNDNLLYFKSFVNNLKSKFFINKPAKLPKKPRYKIFVTCSKKKYVINVYNRKYIALFPWDGTYEMDYIDMSDVKKLYNLFDLCQYLFSD